MKRYCEICGKEFDTIKKGHTRKYCFDCVPSEFGKKGDKFTHSEMVAIKRQAIKKCWLKELVVNAVNVDILKSCGGTNGSVYDSVLNHPIDFLFCLDGQQNMFVIPLEDLKKCGNKKQIILRTHESENGRGFQTYKYQVHL